MRTHGNFFVTGWKVYCAEKVFVICRSSLHYVKEKSSSLGYYQLHKTNGKAIQSKRKILFVFKTICSVEQNCRKQSSGMRGYVRDYWFSFSRKFKKGEMV
jgi:hypothetical protein